MIVVETIFKILLGLIGLSIVVFVHELGHFLAARAVGIHVEAFCLGWGKTIWHKMHKGVDYRIALFPIGGYCKMQGENEFKEAYENNAKQIEPVKGSYYGTNPWRRIIVSVAGPLFNLLFAALVFSIVFGIGFEHTVLPNRIVLATDINPAAQSPAASAGLESGDRITAINGKATPTFQDIQEAFVLYADRPFDLRVDRNGSSMQFAVTPYLNKETGSGLIGVYNWEDPVIGNVAAGSAAAEAGLKAGDTILTANGIAIPYTAALNKVFEEKPVTLNLTVQRNGETLAMSFPFSVEHIDFSWQPHRERTPHYGFFGSIGQGFQYCWWVITVSVRSFGTLFKGIDLTKAVAGPVRITYMMGDAATSIFSLGLSTGIIFLLQILAIISIALGATNLLPLPILDGGSVVLFFVEGIVRKPLNPKFIYGFQTVGAILILGIMAFALFGDIMFFVRG
ncbi:MAG: RIP metalloprotease RseP [Spirochaetaceae bacterium]|jgi:regulator of sigma E protease|nr:RIP metalloprotease RseP [Spirochaetaceae bacterium]